MKAVLVTGTREDLDLARFHLVQNLVFERHKDADIIIHGHCPTGVDACVDELAKVYGIPTLRMPALWDDEGRTAGPKRNLRMVRLLQILKEQGYDCHVYAFPRGESRGTRGCIKEAARAGFNVKVTELPEAP